VPSDSRSTRLYFAIPLFVAAAFLLFSAATGFRFSPLQERFWILTPTLSTTAEYYIVGSLCALVGLLVVFHKREKL